MLTVKSYLKCLEYLNEAAEYFMCVRENLAALSTETDEAFSAINLSDIHSAGEHITATIAKITNFCASEIGVCVPTDNE